jgi:transcriptional regulator, XRE family
MNKFSQRLKELREEYNLTQEQLGEIIGYTQSGIARWEQAERQPDIDMLIKLAVFFNVSVDYLVGNVD